MENSQLKDLQEEVSEATKQYILTTFNSVFITIEQPKLIRNIRV